MVVISYLLGRKYCPVPYNLKRVLGYIALGLALYGPGRWIAEGFGLHALIAGTLCLAIYLALVFVLDARALLRRAPA